VEIVRVELASTTADVISLRARRRGKRICYRWVDEYSAEFRFKPQSSVHPLSLGALIALIDGTEYADNEPGAWAGLTNSYRDSNFHPKHGAIEDARVIANFVTVSSPFYSQLEAWYFEEATEWLDRVTNRLSHPTSTI
jgi:hypothetical protein